MTKSQIANLSFVDNSVYVKTFSTLDKSVIDYCHFYMGYLTFPQLYDLNRFKFFKRLCLSPISPARILFNWFSHDNLNKLCSTYNIDLNMSSIGVRGHLSKTS